MKIKVHVTQNDIDEGQPYLSSNPVALAIRRVLHQGYTLFVYEGCASNRVDVVYNTTKRLIGGIYLPRSAVRFMKRRTAGKPVKPFKFFIEVDHWWVEYL